MINDVAFAWGPTEDFVQQLHVLVIGDAMLDCYISGNVTRVSPEDPTCLVLMQDESPKYRLGGAANVALNAATLGADVELVSLDGIPRTRFCETMAKEVESTNLRLCYTLGASRRQFTTKTRYCSNGKQLLRVDKEDKLPLTDEEVEQLIAICTTSIKAHKPDIVILSDYAKGVLLSNNYKFLNWLLTTLRVTAIPYIVAAKQPDLSVYGYAEVICLNDNEWQRCRRDKIFANHVVVTDGARGCIIMPVLSCCAMFDKAMHIPVEPAAVCDPTGAGDTFIATLAVMLACGMNIKDACELANLGGRYAVSQRGTVAITFANLKEARHG